MDREPVLELRHVYAPMPVRDTPSIVTDISLALHAGELVALMGPSGSGKTTIIEAACGLIAPVAGETLVHGSLIVRPRDWSKFRRASIGLVDQFASLLDALTVAENVALPLDLDRRSGRTRRAAVERALERVGATDLASRYPSELSGGERQRVSLARAIVGDRTVVLADEPTGALDSASAEDVVRLLADLASSGVGILLVTHDPGIASWADRIVYLRDGRIVEDSTLQVPPHQGATS